MKRNIIILAAAALLAVGCQQKKADTVELNNIDDTLSWIMGEYYAQTMPAETFFELDADILAQAIVHTLKGLPQPIDDTTFSGGMQLIVLQNYAYQKHQDSLRHRNIDSVQNDYFRNLVATNKKVKKHPSGFYYEVVRDGKGPRAQYRQRILFDYRSFTLDGQPFDQTYGDRGSIMHVVGEPMFPGLIEAFQLMNAGSLYRFYFPYQLLAGDKSSGSVQAYTPMIYEIELHETYPD